MTQDRAKWRIQVVEDADLLRGLLRAQLTARGYDVRTASDGESALERFPDDRPDLVLLDVHLPGAADGLEVGRRMRQERTDVPILFMTAGASAEVRARALSFARSGLLLKPFDVRTLVARIEALLPPEAR